MKLRLTWFIGALVTALLLLSACSSLRGTSSLLLGGDVMLARAGEPIFSQTSPWDALTSFPTENRGTFFAVNLESPIGDITTVEEMIDPGMNLCASESEISVLTEAGIDLVTTANNHMKDCARSNSGDMAQQLQDAGIESVGANEVQIRQVGRQYVAFLAVAAYSDELENTGLMEKIKLSRENSDLVVVSIHWGNEYQAGPSEAQVELAQKMIDAGADLVWGHHPHVLQRMEWLESTVDGHRALVMYSLGNLLSDQRMLPDASRSALVRAEFKNHEITGIEVLPLLLEEGGLTIAPTGDVFDLITERLGLADLATKKVRIDIIRE